MSSSLPTAKNVRMNASKLYLILCTILLLLVGAVLFLSLWNSRSNSEHHSLIRSSCSSTLYPDLCFSSVSSSLVPSREMKMAKDVIRVALEHTISSTQHNYFVFKKKLASRSILTIREVSALHDCQEMVAQALEELKATLQDFLAYPNVNRSIAQFADDITAYLSGAMTNQESCLDGFSHDSADKKVREPLVAIQTQVFRLCSNVLAMIKNMTETDMVEQRSLLERKEHKIPGRELGSEQDDTRAWPEWLSTGDRRLLQATTITPDITVAADGSGNYPTVSAAVAAAPERSTKRFIIRIKAGVYRENVVVPIRKTNLMFVGDGRTTTIITGSRNVVDGSTTFNSATVAAVLQNCDIHARRPNPGQRNMVTAQGRDDPNQNTGIVIQKCRIGATSDLQAVKGSVQTYLELPWKMYSRTVIMQSSISDIINPAGWYEWNGDFALNTLYYAEHANTGAGASTANRVNWRGYRVITANEAQAFTASRFIVGGNWLPSTGFPYSLGL